MSDAAGVTLTSGATMEANLICSPDVTLSMGAVAGTLTTNNSQGIPTPLSKGKITLKDANGETVAVTYTADDGEFAFYDLADGVYTLLSYADGYLASSDMTVVITNGSIATLPCRWSPIPEPTAVRSAASSATNRVRPLPAALSGSMKCHRRHRHPGKTGGRYENQHCRQIPVRQRDRRELSGQGKTGT